MAMVEGAIHRDYDEECKYIYIGEYQHYVEVLLEIKRERIDQTEGKKNDKCK